MKRVLAVTYAAFAAFAFFAWWTAPRAAHEPQALLGVWSRYDGKDVGDPLRFYYFHEGGIGLYRYGKVGLNNTNSFDWTLQGDHLVLAFRKTGERFAVDYEFSERDGQRWLVLAEDPRGGPGPVRYRYVPPPPVVDDVGVAKGPALGGRLWIDLRKYATGGAGFSMYQLNQGAIDGRGVGWFHRGDFDDWSTEALTYRVQGDRLELDFLLSGEHAATRFTLSGTGDARAVELLEDPRDFWHRHRLKDGGPSFAALSRLTAGLDVAPKRR